MRAISTKFSIVLAGLALSAYFWLPTLGERDFVHIKFAHQGFLDLREWLIDPLGANPNSGGWSWTIPGHLSAPWICTGRRR